MKIIEIKEAVEKVFGVRLDSKTRVREVVDARKIYSIIACEHTRSTLTDIGKIIGRNHSMVTHYRKTGLDLLYMDDFFYKRYEETMVILGLANPKAIEYKYYYHLNKSNYYKSQLK